MRMYVAARTRGQAVVLAGLAIVLLVAMVGLGVDGANTFVQRRNTNNAADAAAMAGTRALLDSKQQNKTNSATNAAVYQAVQQYLTNNLSASGTFTWEASYVDKQGQEVHTLQASDSSNAPSQTDPSDSSKALVRGVNVEVHYTFDTYFITVLAFNTLTVGAESMAVYGPIGEVIGSYLIPLGFDQTSLQKFKDSGGDPLSINLFDPTPDKGGFSYDIDLGGRTQIFFGDNANAKGTGNDCKSTTPKNTSSYWWCNGSPNPIQIGDLLNGNSGTLPDPLSNEIQWRINNQPLVLTPIYVPQLTDSGIVYNVRGFMALELVKKTGPELTAKYVGYYTVPGGISESNVDTGTYAINLVR